MALSGKSVLRGGGVGCEGATAAARRTQAPQGVAKERESLRRSPVGRPGRDSREATRSCSRRDQPEGCSWPWSAAHPATNSRSSLNTVAEKSISRPAVTRRVGTSMSSGRTGVKGEVVAYLFKRATRQATGVARRAPWPPPPVSSLQRDRQAAEPAIRRRLSTASGCPQAAPRAPVCVWSDQRGRGPDAGGGLRRAVPSVVGLDLWDRGAVDAAQAHLDLLFAGLELHRRVVVEGVVVGVDLVALRRHGRQHLDQAPVAQREITVPPAVSVCCWSPAAARGDRRRGRDGE